ncbi:unnamed protein product [Microthlaspi erraticum]|uniref:F-box associated beta-propeller type 1 domain-containing protein n=1 Tax=Microthlaspi erraticum TaxID=1685480 RepID=A0A6D2LF57_9BRAS|nr:unnamed protein product [Microthlaspi erraticum]
MSPHTGFKFEWASGGFFIDEDEEKKFALLFDLDGFVDGLGPACRTQTAYIIGEDGYYKSLEFEEEAADVRMLRNCNDPLTLVSSCYLPSLVQIKKPQERKRKERDA